MKTVRGMVVAAKMTRAVVVRVERLVEHPVYSKTIVQRNKVHARDELSCQVGDLVELEPTRPLSRTIRWRVVKVLGRRALPDAPVDVSGARGTKAGPGVTGADGGTA